VYNIFDKFRNFCKISLQNIRISCYNANKYVYGRVKKVIIKNAEDLLKKYNITDVPVDVEAICRNEGIEISVMDLREVEDAHNRNISGALILKDSKKEIIVNEKDIHGRRRFTIAHELGHFFLHHCKKTNPQDHVIISYRGARNKIEFEADEFAAELLMPKKHVTRILQEVHLPYISILAHRFDVSKSAMRYRLHLLDENYIDL